MAQILSDANVSPIGYETLPGVPGKAVKGQSMTQMREKESEGRLSTLDSSEEHRKLDERNLSVVEEGCNFNTGDHSSKSDCEMEEIAYKVKFCVKETAFTAHPVF